MKKKTASTTIYSLSRDLCVAPATVSKALNHSPEISPELRAKIQAVASQKGFKPRKTNKKCTNIGLLVQNYENHPFDFTSNYFGMILEGVARYTNEVNIELSLFARNVDYLNNADLVRVLKRNGIDGVVVMCANSQSEFYDQLDRQKFPYYSLITNNGQSDERLLKIDNFKVGYTAARYLIDLGHKSIGVIAAPASSCAEVNRLEGVKAAFAETGIDMSGLNVQKTRAIPYGYEAGRLAAIQLMKEHKNTTAVFATSNETAVGALNGLWTMGIKVPDEVSVIACDDYPQSAYTTPPLTTVNIPNREIGYICAKQVHRLIKKEPLLDCNIYLEPGGKLIMRESCAPPRKG